MKKDIFAVLLLVAIMACDTTRNKTGSEEKEADLPLVEVPPSYLGLNINFPARELKSGLNRILPKVLIDDAVPMKRKSDSLYIKIKRTGDLDLKVHGGEVEASIPLEIEASIVKKVLGVTFSNVDAPVVFSGTVRSTATVDLRDDWELDVYCKWQGMDWEDPPTISMAGFKLDLESTIEQLLDDHSDELSDIICQAIRNAVSFRQVVERMWKDIQEPKQIRTAHAPLWLTSEPVGLAGETLPKDDTLALSLEYRTTLGISSRKKKTRVTSLPDRGELLHARGVFLAYPEIFMPYKDLAKILSQEMVDRSFRYEGYQVTIEAISVAHKGQLLELTLETRGDIQGMLVVYGKPVLDEDLQLTLADFRYELDAKDELVALTDWAVHAMAEEYIASLVSVDARPFLGQLDELITNGLARSPAGSKMSLDLDFDKVTSYQLRMTGEGMQWIFAVEGKSALNLKGGLFR